MAFESVTGRIQTKRGGRHETDEMPEIAVPGKNQDGTDELLDEIDTILEDQEALTTYRQKGGE